MWIKPSEVTEVGYYIACMPGEPPPSAVYAIWLSPKGILVVNGAEKSPVVGSFFVPDALLLKITPPPKVEPKILRSTRENKP